MSDSSNGESSKKPELNKIEHQIIGQRIVTQELRRKFQYIQEKPGSIWIRCPLPEHGKVDHTPSLKFNLDPNAPVALGFCYCFGCGQRMQWNTFAEKYGLEKLRQVDTERHYASGVQGRIRKIYARSQETSSTLEGVVDESWGVKALYEPSEDWRGIPYKVISNIGGKLGVERVRINNEPDNVVFLYLPVNVNNITVGAVKARLEKIRGYSSYFNSTGEWAKLHGLFPFDYVKSVLPRWGLKTVVLSEGPRDALNGIANKLPVLSILGVKQWTETKRNLLLSLDIEKVVLAFDGDIHGVRATSRIYKDLNGYIDVDFVDVRKYNQIDKETGNELSADLGEAPEELINELTELVYA